MTLKSLIMSKLNIHDTGWDTFRGVWSVSCLARLTGGEGGKRFRLPRFPRCIHPAGKFYKRGEVACG